MSNSARRRTPEEVNAYNDAAGRLAAKCIVLLGYDTPPGKELRYHEGVVRGGGASFRLDVTDTHVRGDFLLSMPDGDRTLLHSVSVPHDSMDAAIEVAARRRGVPVPEIEQGGCVDPDNNEPFDLPTN